MHISIALGIAIGLIASFIQSLGLTMQRKSHVLNDALPHHHRKLEYRRPLWLLGFAVFISSNLIGGLVQIASLPVVILAPLGAVSLLWNAFFAYFLLGDVFSPWMIFGTLLIAGGAVLIGVYGIVPEPTRSLEDLLALFRRPTFVAYFSLLGMVVFVLLIITHIAEFSFRRKSRRQSYALKTPRSQSPPRNRTSLVREENLTEQTPLLNPKAPSVHSSLVSLSASEYSFMTRTRLLLALSFSSFSGILAGMCLIFAKSGVELLLLTLQGDNQFWRWQAWILVLALLLFGLLQLWYLHLALTLADPTIVCPLAFCVYNLSSIINGLVYFNQFSLIPPLHLGLVVLGIVVLLGGVWIVSINSGDGGVDVGTWQEADDDEELSSSITQSEGEFEPGTRPTSFGPSSSRLQLSGEPGRAGHSRPSIISIPESPFSILNPSHDRRITDSVLLSPSSTASKRRRSWWLDGSSTLSPGGSNAPLILPGGGLQIGLSAVSPGFSLLPKRVRRKRAVSGYSVSGGQPRDGEDDTSDGVRTRRRTLSDGDLSGPLPRFSAPFEESELPRSSQGQPGPMPDATNEIPQKRRKWKWLGKLVRLRG